MLHILFVRGKIKVEYTRYPHHLHCNQTSCNQKSSLYELEPWPTCLARYELQGALVRFDHAPPESRHLCASFRRIKSAVALLDAELSKPDRATLRAELRSQIRFSSISGSEQLTNLSSTVICQSIISYFGAGWYVHSVRNGPVDRIWHTSERYMYIQSGTGQSWRRTSFRNYEQLSPRCWILLAACYIGNVSLFKHFASSRRSRQRHAANRIIKLLHAELLVVAAKNGHAELVDYLISIQDCALPEARAWNHLVFRAALHSGKPEIVKSVLRLMKIESDTIQLAFGCGNIPCLLAYGQSARNTIMSLIREQCHNPTPIMCHKIMQAAYALGDTQLLREYVTEGDTSPIHLLPFGIHGPALKGHLDCLKVTPLSSTLSLPMYTNTHEAIGQEFLVKNRFDLFLQLCEHYGAYLSTDLFSYLPLADGAEGMMIEILRKIKESSKAEHRTMREKIGTLPIELAASALRAGPLAVLLAAGGRPNPTVTRFAIRYSRYVVNMEAFCKTKAVLERFGCCPLVLDC